MGCACNKGKAAAPQQYTVTWSGTDDSPAETVDYASRPAAIVAMAQRPGGVLKRKTAVTA